MKHATALDYRQRLIRALRHIQENLDDDLSPAALAQIAHFSAYHFSRVFSAMVGESIGQHVRRLRLERAAGQIRRSDRTILEVALAAGYDSHEAFTRAFRAHFDCQPSKWRDARQDPELPPAACHVHYGSDEAVSRFTPLLKDNPMLDIRLERLPGAKAVGLRHAGNYADIGVCFQRLAAWAGPAGLFGPATQVVGVYYDDPKNTPAEKLRSAACITLDRPLPPGAPEWVEPVEVPAGLYAIARFRGPYSRLDEAYQWLFGTWLPGSGHEPADGPCVELYRNNPQTTPPEELLTDIAIPLQSANG